MSDAFMWKGTSNGKYSTRSFCRLCLNIPEPPQQVWKLLWSSYALRKVVIFCWRVSWAIWTNCFYVWNISLVLHKDPASFCIAWMCALPLSSCNRNTFDFQQLLDVIMLRVLLWSKAKWLDVQAGVMDMVRAPNLVKIPRKSKGTRSLWRWLDLGLSYLKFNVDGSSFWKTRPGRYWWDA
ncbi:hypothetical protein DITRI_Ditri09bG0093200 [Diplodiscus trichospermus]